MTVNVLVVRGHQVTPWELRPWAMLPDRFAVRYLATPGNQFAEEGLAIEAVAARTARERLPGQMVRALATAAVGDRYRDADEAFAAADVVHAQELSYWYAADAARRRPGARFKLVQTVWETIPFLDAYRNRAARKARAEVLAHTDLFLAATPRARDALLLEGVPRERIEVCPPGIDVGRFAVPVPDPSPAQHVILSPGRLVWEKGHQDVLRAVAALRRGLVAAPDEAVAGLRVRIVGRGPEQERLRAHASELGIAELVSFDTVPYEEMPAVYADASAMVLASLPLAGMALHPFDVPRAFWEEQFGLVLAEAMAAGLPIVTTTSGAIPEVVAEPAVCLAPGDWMGIAQALAAGPLSRPPATRVAYPAELVERYSTAAAATRLAAAYERVLDAA